MFVQQRVDDRPQIDFGRATDLWRRDGDERRDGVPLRIGQIRLHTSLDRIEAHVVAYEIAPHQNGMVAIMIPHIRVSDRPLSSTLSIE